MNVDYLSEFKASYMTDKVVVLFKNNPTLRDIEKARKLLDQVTDTLVMEAINEDNAWVAVPTKRKLDLA